MAREYPWKICAAPRCATKHRRLLKYCPKHERRLQRTGSPEGRQVQHRELNPFRPEVAALLNRWAGHEAIIAGLELMHELLHFYGQDSDRAATGRRARPYLDKVIRDGGDARSCLIEVASLAFYYQHHNDWPEEAVQVMAFATRVLLSQPKAGTSKNSWPRKVIAALGSRIVADLRPLTVQMWVVYKRSQDKLEARRKLAGGFADAT